MEDVRQQREGKEEVKGRFVALNFEVQYCNQQLAVEFERGQKRWEKQQEFKKVEEDFKQKQEAEELEMFKVDPEVLALDEDYDCRPYDNSEDLKAELKRLEEEQQENLKKQLAVKAQMKKEQERKALRNFDLLKVGEGFKGRKKGSHFFFAALFLFSMFEKIIN